MRLKAEVIVNRITQSLFAAQIPFRHLHADVSEQELDLLKFSIGQEAVLAANLSNADFP